MSTEQRITKMIDELTKLREELTPPPAAPPQRTRGEQVAEQMVVTPSAVMVRIHSVESTTTAQGYAWADYEAEETAVLIRSIIAPTIDAERAAAAKEERESIAAWLEEWEGKTHTAARIRRGEHSPKGQ